MSLFYDTLIMLGLLGALAACVWVLAQIFHDPRRR